MGLLQGRHAHFCPDSLRAAVGGYSLTFTWDKGTSHSVTHPHTQMGESLAHPPSPATHKAPWHSTLITWTLRHEKTFTDVESGDGWSLHSPTPQPPTSGLPVFGSIYPSLFWFSSAILGQNQGLVMLGKCSTTELHPLLPSY